MSDAMVFERDGHLYMVGQVRPVTPGSLDLDELAFSHEIKNQAPNGNLIWLKGEYVEGDRPNRNGQLWSSDELAIKSLTPKLMPVTVMHDPSTAVGLIADTKLLTPEKDGVPRARIDTVLAIWGHRFPQVADEISLNYKQGTLMQSMECAIDHYSCTECGRTFVKLPQDAERAGWCDHLKESAAQGPPVRRLEGVTFTGTGLIFGTRSGATGALDTAHLETFQNEVAEFHERVHTDRRATRRISRMDTIEIKRDEYDALKASAAKADELSKEAKALKDEAARAEELQARVEKLEIEKKAAEDAHADEKAKREQLEETARAAELSTERLNKLGAGFVAKLPESVKSRLEEQSKTLTDEDWTARLDELSELTGVKHDDATSTAAEGTATSTETASTRFGRGASASAGEPSRMAVSTVLDCLFKDIRPQTPAKK